MKRCVSKYVLLVYDTSQVGLLGVKDDVQTRLIILLEEEEGQKDKKRRKKAVNSTKNNLQVEYNLEIVPSPNSRKH